MSLHFILGGPGSGKSTKLMERLIRSASDHPDRKHVILVPEQYTMQTQRNIVRLHPNHAVMNIDILSFERLAYRVLEEVGREDMTVLTPIGKNMMLRRICAEHEDELSVYRRSIRKPGFISRLMKMISEFYQYGITSEQLALLPEKLHDHPLLGRKLTDLKICYEAMEELKGQGTMAAEELLPMLVRLLPASDFLKDAYIAMDCFTGFTPVQLELIKQMLYQAGHMEMVFLLPKEDWREESREEDLFHMSQDTVFRLRALAKECMVPVDMEFGEADLRHKDHPELTFLGQHFLRNDGASYGEIPADVSAVSLRNPREEAEYAASVIRGLVMNEGLRYREIAVVTGDMEEYRPLLENAFRRQQIPAFIDRKKGILGNPLVEYVRSALAAVRQDMSYEAVFRFLKCGIRTIPEEDLDLLDNYCLAHRIRGRKHWEEVWEPENTEDKMLHLNDLRLQVLTALDPVIATRNLFIMEEDGKNRITLKDRTAVLRRLIDPEEIRKQMLQMAEILREEEDRPEDAAEYESTYDFLTGFFDQMDDLMGRECLSLQEFSDLLDAGLTEARLGAYPQTLDRVQVGDIMRSRLGDIRVLIVLGFNEGCIPGLHVGGGILSENERAMLAEKDVILAPTQEHIANQERFYLFRLLTAPSDAIYLTASRMGSDGKARRVSWLWDHLIRIFPELTMTEGTNEDLIDRITGPFNSWNLWAGSMQELKQDPENEELLSLGECLRETDPERMEAILAAAFDPERMDSIGKSAAAALYGTTIGGSITRLERYASCAYAHFLSYGLALRERDTGDFRATDRGEFFHKILEVFFRTCVKADVDLNTLTAEERKKLTMEALASEDVQKICSRMEDSASAEYVRRRWHLLAERTIDTVCSMLAEEAFSPAAFELPFNGRSTPSLRLQLGDDEYMVLNGKVDRLDTMRGEDGIYLRIVDYKTGTKKLDLNQVYYGLQMQLPMYMNAVMDRQQEITPDLRSIPAGICYYELEEPYVETSAGFDPAEVEKAIMKDCRLDGMILDEPQMEKTMPYAKGLKVGREQFAILGDHVRRRAQKAGREILDGNIKREPVYYNKMSGCTYCPYAGVCGFNARRAGSCYRTLKPIDKDDIWTKLEEE